MEGEVEVNNILFFQSKNMRCVTVHQDRRRGIIKGRCGSQLPRSIIIIIIVDYNFNLYFLRSYNNVNGGSYIERISICVDCIYPKITRIPERRLTSFLLSFDLYIIKFVSVNRSCWHMPIIGNIPTLPLPLYSLTYVWSY